MVDPEWHQFPKDDAWRQVHLAHVEKLGVRLWLHCNACGHSLTPEPKVFATEHGLEMTSPLLSIARRLRYSHCGERDQAFRAVCVKLGLGANAEDNARRERVSEPIVSIAELGERDPATIAQRAYAMMQANGLPT